ncbi:phosphatase PAP2 family protein [Streptomyces sp. NPDC047123]|uniref:phosphatase PAP2 family protein n=1 Tax=Streptomyces sp. NPDC047123 TaxID=3155622 RepID=UPI0033CF30BE
MRGPTGRGAREAARPAGPVLPPALRAWCGPVAGLAALVVVVLGVLYAGHTQPGTVDRWFVEPTEDSVRPPWRGLALAIDFLGEPVGAAVLVLAAVAGCLLRRRPRAAVFVVVGVVLTVGTGTLLKSVVGRTIHGDDNLSYPSGHTAFLTALAVMTALLALGRLRLGGAAATAFVLAVSLAAGAAMGWAQVALGAHYPTDVLGGWCIALALVPAAAWLVDLVADRRGARAADVEGREEVRR